jgi:hypothetical protein
VIFVVFGNVHPATAVEKVLVPPFMEMKLWFKAESQPHSTKFHVLGTNTGEVTATLVEALSFLMVR